METIYRGERFDGPGTGRAWVMVGDKREELPPRYDLANHSPDGFEWGYGGSGPAQLALAICAHALGDGELAQMIYQTFKAHIARISTDHWTMKQSWVLDELDRIIKESPQVRRHRLWAFGDTIGCHPDGTIWERPWPWHSAAEQMVLHLGRGFWCGDDELRLPRSCQLAQDLIALTERIDPGVRHLESHLAHKAEHGT